MAPIRSFFLFCFVLCLFCLSFSSLCLTSLNAGLYVTELYNLDYHPTNPNIVLCGAQDNSTQYSRNGNVATWEVEIGGAGGYCGINQNNPQTQFGSVYFGNIFQTSNEWSTFSTIQSGGRAGAAGGAPGGRGPGGRGRRD